MLPCPAPINRTDEQNKQDISALHAKPAQEYDMVEPEPPVGASVDTVAAGAGCVISGGNAGVASPTVPMSEVVAHVTPRDTRRLFEASTRASLSAQGLLADVAPTATATALQQLADEHTTPQRRHSLAIQVQDYLMVLRQNTEDLRKEHERLRSQGETLNSARGPRSVRGQPQPLGVQQFAGCGSQLATPRLDESLLSARDSLRLDDMMDTVARRMHNLMNVANTAVRASVSPSPRANAEHSCFSFSPAARLELSPRPEVLSPCSARASSTHSPARVDEDAPFPTQRTLMGELSRATAVVERAAQLEKEQASRDQRIVAHERELTVVHRRLRRMEGVLTAERERAQQLEQIVKEALWAKDTCSQSQKHCPSRSSCASFSSEVKFGPQPIQPAAFSFGPVRMLPVAPVAAASAVPQRAQSLSPTPVQNFAAGVRAAAPCMHPVQRSLSARGSLPGNSAGQLPAGILTAPPACGSSVRPRRRSSSSPPLLFVPTGGPMRLPSPRATSVPAVGSRPVGWGPSPVQLQPLQSLQQLLQLRPPPHQTPAPPSLQPQEQQQQAWASFALRAAPLLRRPPGWMQHGRNLLVKVEDLVPRQPRAQEGLSFLMGERWQLMRCSPWSELV